MDKTTQYYISQIKNAEYSIGKIVGAEDIAREIMELSAQLFVIGNDDLAKYLRTYSLNITKNAKIAREKYAIEHKVASDAWSILDNCIRVVEYPECYLADEE